MKTSLIAITLCAATAALITFYPHADSRAVSSPSAGVKTTAALPLALPEQRARIEVVFVLDTTGSMSGLIAAAKDKIWSIAASMAQAEPAPEIRLGLVAFRDRGDAYVTQRVDLSTDLDSLYAQLMQFEAGGGGDMPEAVTQALGVAVREMSWSADDTVYKAVFLLGDAPPHMDYQDEPQYAEVLQLARTRGIVINTVQCGNLPAAQTAFMHIAKLAQGRYFKVAQDGDAVAISTPFDSELARLSAALDDTRIFFGDAAAREITERKAAATATLHAAASPATRARRATFNASASGAANFAGEHELVAAVRAGTVALDSLPPSALPAALAAMTADERTAAVEEKAATRERLEDQIRTLSADRDHYISAQLDTVGAAEESLDEQIYTTVRTQAAAKGLRFEGTARH